MKKLIDKLVWCTVASVLLAAYSTIALAQNPSSAPPARPAIRVWPTTPPPSRHRAGETMERSIKVDSGVNLSLCVTQATIKANGWGRNEVRVFVRDGSKFGFKVQQTNPTTGEPALVAIVGLESNNKYASSDCISGGEIEIDAPLNARINLRGVETTTTVDSVKRVDINTIGGDIAVRNVNNGITASAGQGDITVEESAGAMILKTTEGNILVFEARPSEIGDMFSAKTNSGSISLQRLGYRQIEVNSISGSVAFNGEILSGGAYSLSTSKGSLRLAIPANSACQVLATYGYGNFSSEIPIKIATENISEGPVKSVVGKLGSGGDATIKLTTNNGSISIKKQ